MENFQNQPPLDFSKEKNRKEMGKAISNARKQLGWIYSLIVDKTKVYTQKNIPSINPALYNEIVGKVSKASVNNAEEAVSAANKAFNVWSRITPKERAMYLLKAADLMEEKRFEFAAWQILEVGKNWYEADAEVCEAIDMLRYYAEEIIRLGKPILMRPDLPGETNSYGYRPIGAALVISPWNFPLAITCGMTSASLAAGNTVILKPSSQSPVIAFKMVEIFREARLPDGALNFLPGSGSEIGDWLVSHPLIDLIAFTGSKDVGLRINRLAAENPGKRGIKRVIAEMGGKNAVIVDSDADIDETIKGAIASAFSFQGQKCSALSRLIIPKNIREEFLARFIEAVDSITIGSPEDPGNFMGPVIDANSLKNIKNYIETGKKECKLLYEREVKRLPSQRGFFVGPTVFEGSENCVIFKEEIFGPVLLVIKAENFDDALRIANNSEYALTAGLYSRNPKNIGEFKKEILANVKYINRKITGAQVGRQPFGGSGMSGFGDSKAGGPDYLPLKFLQIFMTSEIISENTMRRGYAPLD